jgi:heme-degrading monooxygenase HmoA
MSKYAVIFRAKINQLDSLYSETAALMRNLAMNEYGCTEFISSTEGNTEVAISYWPSLENIQAWKSNPEHQKAQALGMSKWYKSHQVQVVEVLREYARENT